MSFRLYSSQILRQKSGFTEIKRFDAVILAGGRSLRMGGIDKVLLRVGDRSMLDRAIAAVAAARRIVVVGPRRATETEVHWTREEPPDGGPVAALAAGLGAGQEDLVAVVAADMPLIDAGIVASLLTAVGEADGALLRDVDGRLQPLAAVYRRRALSGAFEDLGAPENRSMQDLLSSLRLNPLDAGELALDCDTPEQLRAAEEIAGR